MIDPKLFTVEKLLAHLLDSMFGNDDAWRSLAEIVPNYMPLYPGKDTQPSAVVRVQVREPDAVLGEFVYLRAGRCSLFWDVYGDDFHTPENALLALLEAPIPGQLLKKEVWERLSLQALGRGALELLAQGG